MGIANYSSVGVRRRRYITQAQCHLPPNSRCRIASCRAIDYYILPNDCLGVIWRQNPFGRHCKVELAKRKRNKIFLSNEIFLQEPEQGARAQRNGAFISQVPTKNYKTFAISALAKT